MDCLEMNSILNIAPDDLFNSLKCYLCGKYLSVGPVISITDDGKPYKCGRCKDIPSKKTIRNLCYENVAAYLTFPCSYQNCKVKLCWDQVENHEKCCQYRVIRCVHRGCKSSITIENFEKHFKTHSQERTFDGNIHNFSIKKYSNSLFLLKNVMQEFIIVIRYSHTTLYAGVFSLQSLSQTTFFNLTISSNVKYSPSITYTAQVDIYDELLHCINCMRKKCHLLFHKYSVHYENNGLNVDLLPLKIHFESLEKLLLAPTKLMYSVSTYVETATENVQISESSSESCISNKLDLAPDLDEIDEGNESFLEDSDKKCIK